MSTPRHGAGCCATAEEEPPQEQAQLPPFAYPETSVFKLEELPPDALARIMQQLTIRDIHSVLLASKGLHDALQDERVWYGLCTACWGSHTDPHRWLVAPVPATPRTPTRATLPAPQTYRKLYMLLHESAPIVGLWRLQGEGPRGALVHFRWQRDGIEGREVEVRSPLTGKADASLWARISPARGLTTAVRVEPGGGHATVTVYGAQGRGMHKSPSAEAAAAVALPHSQKASPSLLGTSPVGSFEHEWLEFMSSNVQNSKRGKQRRRSLRGAGQARPEGPAIYHLKRVQEVHPSARHPHRGIWAADYGPQGLEVLALSYDFSGRAAQLQAVKVVGDDLVPAGQVSWRCQAAALATPWPAEVQDMVQRHEERWLQEQEWLEEEEEKGGDDSGDDDDGGGSLAGGSSLGSLPPLPAFDGDALPGLPGPKAAPRVVAIHEGSGQVAGPGFAHPEWVAGRLLAYADGGLAFVWGEGLNQITEMRRLRLPRL